MRHRPSAGAGRRRNDECKPGRHPTSADREGPSQDDRHGDIIFGIEPIREMLAAAPSAIRVLYIEERGDRFDDEIARIRAAGGEVVRARREQLARMAGSEGRHQGIIALIREYGYIGLEEALQTNPDPLLVIDGVTDPRNLGAILRSAECAGADTILLARDRTVGVTPAAIKASAGAWVHQRIARCGNVASTLGVLKERGYWTAALAPGGETSLYELDTARRLALVIGAEDRGVRELVRKRADFVVGIPMRGKIGSLNVAVATAVALFEIARRRSRIERPSD